MADDVVERVLGADGIYRTPQEEKKINQLVSLRFRGRAGQKALAYLRSITMDTVAGPNVDTTRLMHLEGQRFVVAIIIEHIERARDPGRVDRLIERRPKPQRFDRKKKEI